jgi:3,4-dihydroxy-9,10-secoandrosta-1,3,5(10)-triene-9,17-dione 4,5-dioxygenase
MTIKSLGYIGVNSTQPEQWRQYACQVMGLQDNTASLGGNEDMQYFKMDDHPYRVFVQKADNDGFFCCGWETNNEQGYQDALQRLRNADIAVIEHGAEEAASRRVQALASFSDPSGNRHELYWGVISDFTRMVSPVGVRQFVTGNMGMGHAVLPAPNFDATIAMFRDVLGFGLSDLMKIRFTPDPNEPIKRLWFMHCNSRHHSLAFFEMPHPAGCIHIMTEVDSIDEVGRCNDRRIAQGVGLSGTLGRHANDHMVSFYMKSPGGFDIEYGAEGRVIDDWSKYEVFESTVPSFWGHDFSVGHTG